MSVRKDVASRPRMVRTVQAEEDILAVFVEERSGSLGGANWLSVHRISPKL